MSKQSSDAGFAPIEAILIVVILVLIGFVGWYVLRVKHTASTSLDNATQSSNAQSTKKATTSGTDNASLQADLTGIDKSQSQAGNDASSANNGLNDSNSEITVPTN